MSDGSVSVRLMFQCIHGILDLYHIDTGEMLELKSISQERTKCLGMC